MTDTLSATGLSKTVTLANGDPLHLLRGFSISVASGETVSIIGRSGSGKTTLLSILGLLSRPDAGSVTIDDVDVGRLRDRERARLRNTVIGFVFQSYSLVPHMTARQNVELPLLQGNRLSRAERRTMVDHALELAHIQHRAASMPRQLSGGEQQRTAIARALVRSPRLIIADEPTGALDNTTADAVLEVLFSAAQQRGTAVVLATHDPAVAARARTTIDLRADSETADGTSRDSEPSATQLVELTAAATTAEAAAGSTDVVCDAPDPPGRHSREDLDNGQQGGVLDPGGVSR